MEVLFLSNISIKSFLVLSCWELFLKTETSLTTVGKDSVNTDKRQSFTHLFTVIQICVKSEQHNSYFLKNMYNARKPWLFYGMPCAVINVEVFRLSPRRVPSFILPFLLFIMTPIWDFIIYVLVRGLFPYWSINFNRTINYHLYCL